MPALFEASGGQPRTPSLGKAIHNARFETGLYTNRSPLHDPAPFVVSRFYGGYPDALIGGENMEVSNQLTLIRRPGISPWTAETTGDSPANWWYEFRKIDGSIEVIVDTPLEIFSMVPITSSTTTKTSILIKSAGAGQGYFVGVGDVLYIGDGVDLVQYTPGNANGLTWNWGITAPPAQPTVTVVESGNAAVAWKASSVFSTMGFIVDSNVNVQQLISVNASGTNTTRYGSTGNGEPAFDLSPGGTTTDGTITWTNFGPLVPWAATKLFDNFSVGGTLVDPCFCYDSVSKGMYGNTNPSNAAGTTGATRPAFTGVVGAGTYDPASGSHPPGVAWVCLDPIQAWAKNHAYTEWGVGEDGAPNAILTPYILPPPTNQPIFVLIASNAGTSGTGATHPNWATVPGTQTIDNDLIWVNLGPATRATSTAYTAWAGAGQIVFSVIKDPNNNMQVCTQSGTSSTTATASITWATAYGDTTLDNNVVWTCVGNEQFWSVNTSWYLPIPGFAPPVPTAPYGGANVIGGGNVQFCIASGLSGTSAPTWQPLGSDTTDHNVTWYAEAAASTNSLAWTQGYQYAYAFESRESTDIYNTTVPPGLTKVLGNPTGSGTGGVSTISPININLQTPLGANPGAVNTISGLGSTDPQVDTIIIFRTYDGGSLLYELTEIPNPPAIGGAAQAWSYQDYQPDAVLNNFIPAPIDGANNPPPAGFLPMDYYFDRIWGAMGNTVYFSGGPDVVTGNPNESFQIADSITLPSGVSRILGTPTAIQCFTTSDIYGIMGGPATSSFYAQRLVPGIGLLHYNALDIHCGVITMFTADAQLITLDPASGVNRIGAPIADQLATWDPTQVYVTVHESGNDNSVIVSDGATGWYRLCPNQFPNGNPVWSPKANITGGCKAVLSIEVSKGVHKLLVGGPVANQPIWQRDLTVWQDAGSNYPCNATIGSFNLVYPGQVAGLTFVNLRCTNIGTAPTVGFLLNEINGTFTTFPEAQPYPWQIYGATGAPVSLFSNAYYFNAAGVPALAEHAQCQMTFPAENVMNEVHTLTIFGVIEAPPEI